MDPTDRDRSPETALSRLQFRLLRIMVENRQHYETKNFSEESPNLARFAVFLSAF